MLDGLSKISPGAGAIARAADQLEEVTRRRALEQAPRRHLNRAIRVIDSMISLLERYNVRGTPPPALVLEKGMSEVTRATANLGISVTSKRSGKNLMNELYIVQKRLMAMRAGPGWAWAYEDEDRESNELRIQDTQSDCA